MENTYNESKAHRTFSNYINSIKKKWKRDQENVRLLKYETRQLHYLCDKLIADGRLTLDELRENVNSRQEAKKTVLNK